MNEPNLVGKHSNLNAIPLNDQTKFRLNEINKIKDYFNIFDFFDKNLIVLSATSGGIIIIFFTSAIGIPVGIASASFTSISSLTTRIIKHLLKVTRKKRRNTIKLLCFLKAN